MILTGVFLAGCAEQAPLVAQFNGDSVTIQQSTIFEGADATRPEIIAEANRICATQDKSATYASTRAGPNKAYHDHLFLCL